jgi:outer membrane protein assembly factor BamB
MRQWSVLALVCIAGLSVALAGQGNSGDWPQWRGPDRTGLSRETGFLKAWPAAGPRLVWSAGSLGTGHGTIAVKGDRVFVQGSDGKQSSVASLNRADGKPVWSRVLGPAGNRKSGGNGPRSTPTVDGDRVYAVTEIGELACLKAQDGAVVWQRNILKDFKAEWPTFLIAESPLVDGDRVYVTPGGTDAGMVALNKMTGKTIWKSKSLGAEAAYGSIVAADVQGVRTLMTMSVPGGVGVRASDGQIMWTDAHVASRTSNIATPNYFDNKVMYSYDMGSSLLGLTVSGGAVKAKEIYFSPELQVESGGVLLVDGYVYGFNSAGLICLEFATGKRMWRDRSVGKGSLTYADGYLYLLSEDFTVGLAEATPAGYREKGRFKIAERPQPSYAHPVVSGGRLYIRNQDTLAAYDIRAK